MKRIFYILFFILFVTSCAKIGSPTGGGYDRTPPILVNSNPNINSVNFKGNSFEVFFDEYVELKNPSEELMISPPLKTKPQIKEHLNRIKVSWDDTLNANTTYIFDFGSSIVDFNEGNVLGNFAYSFSTGNYIDSLEYRGRVVDAYSLRPVIKKYVMLYSDNDRNIVRKEKPNYVTKTDSSGYFHFYNISEGEYHILVLDDQNQNLLYDLPNEGIAFSNKKIKANYYKNDTINKNHPIFEPLYYYDTKDTSIDLTSNKLISNHQLQLTFSNPTTDSLEIKFDYPKLLGFKDKRIYFEYSQKKDTLTLWGLEINFDSIKFNIKDIGLNQDVELYSNIKDNTPIKDTFLFIAPKLDFNYFSDCLLKMPLPLIDDSTSFEAYAITEKDTTKINCKSYNKSPLYIKVGDNFQQNTKYTIIIKDGLIKNSLGQVNDSIIFKLNVDGVESYGNLLITVKDSSINKKNIILIIEDEKSKIIGQLTSIIGEKTMFRNLEQGLYKLKLVIDENNNGKWDCGNYDKAILPERVIYFEKSINVRKNWDIEEIWNLQPKNN